MDPVLKSAITSIATTAIGSALGWAVTNHYITQDQATALTADIVGGGAIAVGAGLIWWKARQHTQPALIQAVNAADNGVKVVPSTASAPAVSGPLK